MATSSTLMSGPISHGKPADSTKNTQLVASTKAVKAGTQLRTLLERVTNPEDARDLFRTDYVPKKSTTTGRRISGLKDEEVEVLAALLYAFIMEVARNKPANSSKAAFSDELKEAKFPAQFVERIVDSVFDSPVSLTLSGLSHPNAISRMQNFTWRLDVIITSHLGKKILEPVFLVRCSTSTGEDAVFEVPVIQYHKLRVTVATILNQLNGLMSRKVLAS